MSKRSHPLDVCGRFEFMLCLNINSKRFSACAHPASPLRRQAGGGI